MKFFQKGEFYGLIQSIGFDEKLERPYSKTNIVAVSEYGFFNTPVVDIGAVARISVYHLIPAIISLDDGMSARNRPVVQTNRAFVFAPDVSFHRCNPDGC